MPLFDDDEIHTITEQSSYKNPKVFKLMSQAEEEQPYKFSISDEADAWREVNYDYRKHTLTQFKNNNGIVEMHLLDSKYDFPTFCAQSPGVLEENQEQFEGLLQKVILYQEMT